MPNEQGFHTYEEAQEILERGESIRVKGRTFRSVKDLPSKAEYSTLTGDTNAQTESLEEIRRKRAELDRQEALLAGGAGAVDLSGEGAQAAAATLAGTEPPGSIADGYEGGTAGARQKAAEEAEAAKAADTPPSTRQTRGGSSSKPGESTPAGGSSSTPDNPPAK